MKTRSRMQSHIATAFVPLILGMLVLTPFVTLVTPAGSYALSAGGSVATGQASADSVSVACSPSSFALGASTKCTAKVTGNSPGGAVDWSSDASGTFSAYFCTLVSGSCSITYSPAVAVSPITVTGAYGGDANNPPVSGSFQLTVSPSHTTVSVSCSPSPVTIGANSTCTAAVSGQGPTGTVTWGSSVTGLFRPSFCLLSKGKCSTLYTQKSVASATITATYGGDSNNLGGSGSVSLSVVKATTTTSLFCSPSSLFTGFYATCLAVVKGYIPTGIATFSASGGSYSFLPEVGTCTLSYGNCSVGFRGISAGTFSISASYGGDGQNKGSSGKSSVTAILATVFVINRADPVVSHTCSSLGGSWDGMSACSLTGNLAFNSSDYILIRPYTTLLVLGGAILSNSGVINNTGGAFTNQGSVTNRATGEIVNSYFGGSCGTMQNAGTISNLGIISNYCAFTSIDLIKNGKGGTIEAIRGTLVNVGTINNAAGGLIVAAGPAGALNNTGTITNSGAVGFSGGGTLVLKGVAGFAGSFNNLGSFSSNPGGTLEVGVGGLPTGLEVTQGTFGVPKGVTLYIATGSSIAVDSGAALSNQGSLLTQQCGDSSPRAVVDNGSIFNGGTGVLLISASCILTINRGGSLTSIGVISDSGTVTNYGSLANGVGGVLTITGEVVNKGSLSNSGALNNRAGLLINSGNGIISNAVGATIANDAYGSIQNNSGGTLTNDGLVSNQGQVANNSGCQIVNTDNGSINNQSGGSVDNNPGGTIFNIGSVTNFGDISSNGDFSNNGTVSNSGTMTNSGTLENTGLVTNAGSITSSGTITDGGTLVSSGNVVNQGTLKIVSVGSMTNSGTIINSGSVGSNGTVVNDPNGGITNRGLFANLGVFYGCGGPVEADVPISGNAAVSCSAAQAGQATVIDGNVATQALRGTGFSVNIAGTIGGVVGISTALEPTQPNGTGSHYLRPMGSVNPQFFDLGLFGIIGGTAHICISNAAVDARTVIEYYSGSNWTLASNVVATSGTKVCGDIQVSALTGTPVVIGDSAAVTTTATTTRTSTVSSTHTSRSSSGVSTTVESTSSNAQPTTSTTPEQSTQPTINPGNGGGGAIPEFPNSLLSFLAISSLLILGYAMARRTGSRKSK